MRGVEGASVWVVRALAGVRCRGIGLLPEVFGPWQAGMGSGSDVSSNSGGPVTPKQNILYVHDEMVIKNIEKRWGNRSTGIVESLYRYRKLARVNIV